jgi:transcriptional regulator with XRE-family HTH domain
VICVRYIEKAKKIAKKKGIAFTHISTELGKSRGYLSEMLANGRDLPEHMLADVASLLGVTVADLTGDSESEKKPTAQSDGLTEKQKYAIELIKSTSDDDLDKLIEMFKIWTGEK